MLMFISGHGSNLNAHAESICVTAHYEDGNVPGHSIVVKANFPKKYLEVYPICVIWPFGSDDNDDGVRSAIFN